MTQTTVAVIPTSCYCRRRCLCPAVTGPTTPVPNDGIDNDGDGFIDEELIDGVDNDGDGLVDEDTDPPGDFDGDGVPDAEDNCPLIFNSGQQDSNFNGIGDACEDLFPDESSFNTAAFLTRTAGGSLSPRPLTRSLTPSPLKRRSSASLTSSWTSSV